MTSHHLTRRLLSGVAMMSIIALAGCSAGSGGQSGAQSASAQSPSSTTKHELLLAADSGSPTYEKNFNPFLGGKRAPWLYEPLYIIDPAVNQEVPWLAEKYTQPDAKSIDFSIRQGVKWSDGKDFTPSDVIFTFNMLKKYPQLDTKGMWSHVDSVEAKGQDVIVHLKAEDVAAARMVAQTVIVPEHIWSSVPDPTTYTNENPVTTGPYVLGEFTPNQYTLVKNPTYWQADKVKADTLILPATHKDLDLINDKYDWAYMFMSDVKNTWVKADPQHNTYWFPPGGTISLIPNMAKAPYNKVEFRQGVSAALDRKSIADKAAEGYVQVASQTGLMLPGQDKLLDPSIPNKGYPVESKDKALEYFGKIGYTLNGDKLVDKDGKQLSITIKTPNGWGDWLQAAEQVKTQLQAVGLKVDINQPQPPAYQQDLRRGDFDMIMGATGGQGDPYLDYEAIMGSNFKADIGTSTEGNFGRFSSPKADELLNTLNKTVDQGQRLDITKKLENITYSQMPMITLYYGGLWGLFSTAKFTGWPSDKDPYASPMTWGSSPLLIFTHITPAN